MRACLLLCLLLAGCIGQRGSIRTAQGTVVGVKDAGTAATLTSDKKETTATIPAGTPITVTRIAEIPATQTAAFQPAREIVAFTPTAPLPVFQTQLTSAASTGVIDTSVAKHRIDVEENRWLLWASLACIPIAALFFYLSYPTPAFYAIASGVVFFIAWQVAGLPEWIKFLGFGGLIAGVVMWRAHERGLKVGAVNPAAAAPVIPKVEVVPA